MINDFIANVKTRGIARTNRYDVIITDLAGQEPIFNFSEEGELTRLFCEASSLPGMNVATQPNRFYGEVREFPYEPMYDPVQLSFYVDSDLKIKKAFETWQRQIINPNTRTFNYYDTYIKTVDISLLKVDESSIPYNITLYEAYPKTIAPINLSAESREVMKLNVTLQYKYWRMNESE